MGVGDDGALFVERRPTPLAATTAAAELAALCVAAVVDTTAARADAEMDVRAAPQELLSDEPPRAPFAPAPPALELAVTGRATGKCASESTTPASGVPLVRGSAWLPPSPPPSRVPVAPIDAVCESMVARTKDVTPTPTAAAAVIPRKATDATATPAAPTATAVFPEDGR